MDVYGSVRTLDIGAGRRSRCSRPCASNEGRIVRLERHLARLAGAARHFELPVDDEPRFARRSPPLARAHPPGCWRVRLLVSARRAADDRVHARTSRRRAPGAWTSRRSRSTRAIPFSPTRRRDRVVYDTARRSRPDVDDVMLWNERGEVTESTIANVVAEIDGVRYTPPSPAVCSAARSAPSCWTPARSANAC